MQNARTDPRHRARSQARQLPGPHSRPGDQAAPPHRPHPRLVAARASLSPPRPLHRRLLLVVLSTDAAPSPPLALRALSSRSHPPQSIPYALLLSLLSLPDVATLEDLLIAAFYAGVLRGKLDAREQRLEVLSAQGRDVRRNEAPVAEESMELDPSTSPLSASAASQTPASLLASLRTFQSTLAGLIASLSSHLGDLHARALNEHELRAAHEERVRDVARDVGRKDIDGGAGAGAGKKGGAGRKSVVQPQQGSGADGGDMDVDAASAMPGSFAGGGGSSSGGGPFAAFGALAGAIGLGGSGSGGGSGGGGGSSAQGLGRGAAGSPTGGGAAARARKRNRQ